MPGGRITTSAASAESAANGPMPTALNAGTWLYFHAFQKLKSISFMGADATERPAPTTASPKSGRTRCPPRTGYRLSKQINAICLELTAADEDEIAERIVFDYLWLVMIRDYPDLNAEELASLMADGADVPL